MRRLRLFWCFLALLRRNSSALLQRLRSLHRYSTRPGRIWPRAAWIQRLICLLPALYGCPVLHLHDPRPANQLGLLPHLFNPCAGFLAPCRGFLALG